MSFFLSFLWNNALPILLLFCVALFLCERLIVLGRVCAAILRKRKHGDAPPAVRATAPSLTAKVNPLLASLAAKVNPLLANLTAKVNPLLASLAASGTATSADSGLGVNFGFFASFRAPLLLGSVLLTPLTIASTSTLFSLEQPARIVYALFLLFPLALFFLLLEGWTVVSSNVGVRTASDDGFWRKNIWSKSQLYTGMWRENIWRWLVVLFASSFLLSLLFELLPSAAEIFFQQAAQLFVAAQSELAPARHGNWLWELFFSLSLRQGVLLITLFLLTVLGFPLLFARPLRVIVLLLCFLLPLALLFYGTLCFLMLEQSLAYSQRLFSSQTASISGLWDLLWFSMPASDAFELSAASQTSFLLIFRPAFGFFALAYAVNFSVLEPLSPTRTKSTRAKSTRIGTTKISSARARFFRTPVWTFLRQKFSRQKVLNLGVLDRKFFAKWFSLFLLFVLCLTLLFFVMLTLLPILATGSWTLSGLGFSSLYGAFISLYPGESWLLASSLVLLSITTLLGLSALGLLALRLLSSGAERFAVFLFLPLGVWGAFSDYLSSQAGGLGFFERLDSFFRSLGIFGMSISALIFMLALSIMLCMRLFFCLRAVSFSKISRAFYLGDGTQRDA